jgi:GTPase SAR1 family protein
MIIAVYFTMILALVTFYVVRKKPASVRTELPPTNINPKMHAKIVYIDLNGTPTVRNITVLFYSRADDKIHAYCHERKDYRTFFCSKIKKYTSLETGEVPEDIPAFIRNNLYHQTG